MRALTIALLFTLPASTALADAIGPPMEIECPAGARPSTNHCGTVCFVASCATDADCASGEVCAERSLCVEDVSCGGWGATASLVRGECGGGCASGACQSVLACGPPASSGDAGAGGPRHETWGCGCSTAGSHRSSALWLAAIGVALALFRRRR